MKLEPNPRAIKCEVSLPGGGTRRMRLTPQIRRSLDLTEATSDEVVRKEWENRVRHVCKPCWELRYCPYGPLVEDFPLLHLTEEEATKPKADSGFEEACGVFGHLCPVFFVAEPFTETRELRRLGRRVPRHIMFRVVRRDNSQCQVCGKTLKDNEFEFDHIIPVSRGGSSEEHNIRVVCLGCNREKSARFIP